jgi:nitrate reductase gamma subunit
MGAVASRFHFGVFQVAFYHQIVLSPSLSSFQNILIKD